MLALGAALVAAAGPAREARAAYAWPPEAPAASPREGWYAPLPLLNRVPESLDIRVPCDLGPPLNGDGDVLVLGTARRRDEARALRVVLSGDRVSVRTGAAEKASYPWPEACPLRLRVRGGTLTGPAGDVALETGALDDMPVVTGLFSAVDLRTGEPPRVVVRTRPYATSQTARQIVATAVALVAALAALLVLAAVRPRRLARALRLSPAVLREPATAVVAGVLGVWWIFAPTLWDDGWFPTQHRLFDSIGAFNLYYEAWGVNLPLGHWVELLRHPLIGSTDTLVLQRLPAVIVVSALWVACYYAARALIPGALSPSIRWTLTAAFLVGAMAWQMTLRPEPIVALLATVVLLAAIRFVESPGLGPLAVAVLGAALALTVHTTGLVALAPVLAASPQIVGWLRERDRTVVTAAGALVVAGVAIMVALATLGADLATRIGEAQAIRDTETHGFTWWREYLRYWDFNGGGGDTPLRHLSLVVLLASVVLPLRRDRGAVRGMSTLAARATAVALVLLAFVPSKWPWHFGALAGLGAVALAVELASWIREDEVRLSKVRIGALLAALVAATYWVWSAPGMWNPQDSANWRFAFRPAISLGLILVLVLVLGAVAARQRGSGSSRRPLARSVVAWALPVLSAAAVACTVGLLVIDAMRTEWSLGRQNLAALVGQRTCALPDEWRDDVARLVRNSDVRTVVIPPVSPYLPCATRPGVEDGVLEAPALVVLVSRWPLVLPDSPLAAYEDLYDLRLVARGPVLVEVFRVNDGIPGHARIDAVTL